MAQKRNSKKGPGGDILLPVSAVMLGPGTVVCVITHNFTQIG